MNSHTPLASLDPYSDRVANASMLHVVIWTRIIGSEDVMLITNSTACLMLITEINFFPLQVSPITFFA
jgi:hypothetical protein